jgi:hypothetical protein
MSPGEPDPRGRRTGCTGRRRRRTGRLGPEHRRRG